jgi:hypothetical protein
MERDAWPNKVRSRDVIHVTDDTPQEASNEVDRTRHIGTWLLCQRLLALSLRVVCLNLYLECVWTLWRRDMGDVGYALCLFESFKDASEFIF